MTVTRSSCSRSQMLPTSRSPRRWGSRWAPSARGYSLWLISSSPQIEPDVELGEHLRRLLAILEPVAAPLWELARAGYEANWYCFAASRAAERAIEFDRQILQRVLALPGDLWIDVCDDGADDP